MIRKIFTWIGLGLLAILSVVPAEVKAQHVKGLEEIEWLIQNGKGDTSHIAALKTIGDALLEKPGSHDADIRMVFRIAGEMETVSRKLNYPVGIGMSKLLQAKAYRESGHSLDGRSASEEAVQLLNTSKTIRLKGEALLELGGSYSNSAEDLPMKIRLYEQGVSIYKSLGDTLSVAKLNEFVGELYLLNNQFPRALQILMESLSVYQQTGYQKTQGIYSVLGEVHHGLNNFSQSLRYNLLAVEAGEKLKDTGPLMITVYNRVALNYFSLEYYDQALDYFNKGLVVAQNNQDTPNIQMMLTNVADALRNKGRYQASLDTVLIASRYGPFESENERIQVQMLYLRDYILLNDWRKAETDFIKLNSMYQHRRQNDIASQVLRLSLIHYLQVVGRFTETIPYLKSYAQYKDSLPLSKIRRADGEYLSFRTDSALGNFPMAMAHYIQYKALSDSLTSTTLARQMAVLQLQFETERKDKNIELLTQKSKLQEVSLRNEKFFRNVFIAGVGMLVLLSALMYNRYRIKQLSNLELECKQREINKQNEVLKKVVEEKEWLLKEVHHRVKNNLQIVISLLNTQSEYLNNADAIAAIRNSQHRMYAMSLIHQRLYQVENLGTIDMKWYISELIGYMKESFESTDRISFVTQIDQVALDVIQAVPIGLIINEAVSNSIKYAFPTAHKGTISVSLKKTADDNCLLLISDDGIGFLEEVDTQEGQSLGMSLMHGLSSQLDGNFNISAVIGAGVKIRLSFPYNVFNPKTVKTSEG